MLLTTRARSQLAGVATSGDFLGEDLVWRPQEATSGVVEQNIVGAVAK